ncbi:hypothetical protein [Cloacibacillus sp.]|uniref:hypothetical protein n=1 Tax=Cloacibacillus sp. TaxID=2049023 RepID=UPI0025BC2D8D|nr:hypothetical protein [Cloacibacillus sp.]MCC8059215.1 hypothetical protein [Cloacibacillus sp.]
MADYGRPQSALPDLKCLPCFVYIFYHKPAVFWYNHALNYQIMVLRGGANEIKSVDYNPSVLPEPFLRFPG